MPPHNRLYIILLVACASIIFKFSTFLQSSSPCQCERQHQNNTSSSSSSYRERLSTIRSSDSLPHSKTLGVFDRIYVINLAARDDRRRVMSDLERAMDIEFTWHNATFYEEDVVSRIMGRLRRWRIENVVEPQNEETRDPNRPYVFRWSEDVFEESDDALGVRGADLWSLEEEERHLEKETTSDNRTVLLDAYDEDGQRFGKIPLRPSQIACWHSHYSVLRRIAEGNDEVALILEDDIDMEWDLEHRLSVMWPFLPQDWDVVLLGHCMSREFGKPLQGAPTLFPATQSLCNHAYAVNRRSASRLVRYLRSESFAYSRAIDHAVNHLSVSGR